MKKTLLSLSVFVLVYFLFTGDVFAQSADDETIGNISRFLDLVIRFFSRSRVILAKLAGKFMNNSFVYGEIFMLDVQLWTIRNMVKNIANFGVGILFIYYIIQYIINKGDSQYLKKIPKLILGGILIQFSWFIVAALIDLSTVGMAAVGSFPSTFLNSNEGVQLNQRKHVVQQFGTLPKKVEISFEGSSPTFSEGKVNMTEEEIIDMITPKPNDVSGPLLYMGYSIFRFQDFVFLNKDSGGSLVGTFIGTIIKFLLMLMFIVPLLIMFIFNIMRVFYLWLFIPFSPIILLMRAIDEDGKGGLPDRFSAKQLIQLIFQPVVSVALLVISMLFVIGMSGVLQSNNSLGLGGSQTVDLKGATLSSNNNSSSLVVNDIAEVNIIGSVFGNTSNINLGFIGDLLLIFFTGFVLRSVSSFQLEFAGTIGKKLKDTVETPIRELGEGVANNARFLPGGYSYKNIQEGVIEPLSNRNPTLQKREKESAATSDAISTNVKKRFGIKTQGELNNVQILDLKDSLINERTFDKRSNNFFSKLRSIKDANSTVYRKQDEYYDLLSKRLEDTKTKAFVDASIGEKLPNNITASGLKSLLGKGTTQQANRLRYLIRGLSSGTIKLDSSNINNGHNDTKAFNGTESVWIQ